MLKNLLEQSESSNNTIIEEEYKKDSVDKKVYIFYVPRKCKNCSKYYIYKRTCCYTFCSGECKYSYLSTKFVEILKK